jgi:hypothetical protein
MAQVIANSEKPAAPNEAMRFAIQRERLHRRRGVRYAIGDGDGAWHGEIVLCALELHELRECAEAGRRAMLPMTRKEAGLVAAQVAVSYSFDRFPDPAAFIELLKRVLETMPAIAGLAMVDPRNPESLIRTQKFTPSLAEVSEWCGNFLRPIHADLRLTGNYIAAVEQLDRLKREPGFRLIDGEQG